MFFIKYRFLWNIESFMEKEIFCDIIRAASKYLASKTFLFHLWKMEPLKILNDEIKLILKYKGG